ncbi:MULTISPECIES: immunity 22 family protein [unclassified Lysinibacillus]|uniref:immunity 22 family protein n=1 Tax=unclassified Lysinibacillus TaxID=2636778 RepID=UPI0025524845|nr:MULTISPECIES: immunity 22 family protein [unclassified Lysinibacillus]MDM5247626.1 immunity 22 family protein [Lysinibacillus sp. G4S2]
MNMSKVHVWVGVNNVDDETFEKYFELDYDDLDMDIDDPLYKVCQFCLDINEKWYDEDCIGVYKEDNTVDVRVLLEELLVSKETLLEIQDICKKRGLENSNAMFYYMDSEINVADLNKLYNGLTYIGKFCTNL